ncbi:hypothetical protein TanjilG_16645 [Lupinus angustifolius]|uniref:Uncharacterized protein n=1 Tax=Lupinus angustifolius TaxID=3871 RepID=A0A4P1QZX7_LUPAN|nr:hypothetical protein TanjilG_16645 [Lupinus angustifolius]
MEYNERRRRPPPPPPLLVHWFGNHNQPRTRLRLPTTFPVTIIVFTTRISVPIIVTNDSITINVNGAIISPIPTLDGHLIFSLNLPTELNLPVIITIATTTTLIHFLVHPNGSIYNITIFINNIIKIFLFFHSTHSYPLLHPPSPSDNVHENTTNQAITIPITITLNLNNNNSNTFIAIPIYITMDFILISAHSIVGLGTTDMEACFWFSNPRIHHHPWNL